MITERTLNLLACTRAHSPVARCGPAALTPRHHQPTPHIPPLLCRDNHSQLAARSSCLGHPTAVDLIIFFAPAAAAAKKAKKAKQASSSSSRRESEAVLHFSAPVAVHSRWQRQRSTGEGHLGRSRESATRGARSGRCKSTG